MRSKICNLNCTFFNRNIRFPFRSFGSKQKLNMKTLALILLLVAFGTSSQAQLTDTKWKNFMNIPEPTETILQFKKDTLLLIVVIDGSVGETMKYSISKDTLKISKLSGFSPCAEGMSGLYRFVITEDKMTITPISDECQDRADAFKPEAWIREKN